MQGSEEFWAAVGTPLTLFIIALLTYLTRRIEGKVKNAVKNGVVQSAIKDTVNSALDESVQPRLDKIETFTVRTSQRLEDVEAVINGGRGQHFTPPASLIDPEARVVDEERTAAAEEEATVVATALSAALPNHEVPHEPTSEHTVVGTLNEGEEA